MDGWKQLLAGEYGEKGHEVKLFQKEYALALLVPEKRHGRVVGTACVVCKPFAFSGEAAALSSIYLPGELTIVKKMSTGKSYLLAFSTPHYVSASSETEKIIDSQCRELDKLYKTLRDVKGIAVGDFSSLQESEKSELLADPAFLLNFLNMLRSRRAGEKGVIGRTLSGDSFVVPFSNISTALVVGSQRQQRLHTLHLFIEEALQANACVVIFDTRSAFSGLARASSKEFAEYSNFNLAGAPVGFAFKQMFPGKNAFVQLNAFTPQEILSIFSLNETTDTVRLVASALASASTFSDALVYVASSPEPQFSTLRATRIATLMQRTVPNLFSSSASFSNDLSQAIGKVFHIDLSLASAEMQGLFVLGALRELRNVHNKVLLVFEQDAGEISSVVEAALSNCSGTDISIAAHSEHEEDCPQLATADLFVELIGEHAVVTHAGSAPKRIELRPAYSQCSEV